MNELSIARRAWLVMILLLVSPLLGWSESADVTVIARGDRVELSSHLVTGKFTLFDFYADWCSGCRQIEPIVSGLAADHAGQLAVRKIDIVRWSSPVAGQYRLRSIPHLVLFNPEGELLADGDPGSVLSLLESRLGAESTGRSLTTTTADQGSGFLGFFMVAVALLAVSALLYGSLRRPSPDVRASSDTPSSAAPAGESGWFVIIQGSLEGPFSATQLDDMCKRSVLSPEAKVRRKGEVSWQSLNEVIHPESI
jgi:thiol-disulfide isomerase/thioredoxin